MSTMTKARRSSVATARRLAQRAFNLWTAAAADWRAGDLAASEARRAKARGLLGRAAVLFRRAGVEPFWPCD